MRKLNGKALRISFWASMARLISVILAAGAGSVIHQLVGEGLNGWTVVGVMCVVSFLGMWFSEYAREQGR